MTPGDTSKALEKDVRRYATTAAFEAALKTKLMLYVTPHRTYQDVRKQLAFDRVLARLSRVEPESWLLKGGVALEYRLKRARSTADIDVSAKFNLEWMEDVLVAAADIDLQDYFALRIGAVSKPIEDINAFRFELDVIYDTGRRFESLKIDVGFADPWLGVPQDLTAESFLEFAGIAPATIRAIPLEQHLAEKVHAYTKNYGGYGSSRIKDLVDMALLIESASIDYELFATILHQVFHKRATHEIPAALPPPPTNWKTVYPRLASGLPIPQGSDEAYRYVAAALDAPLKAGLGKQKSADGPSLGLG